MLIQPAFHSRRGQYLPRRAAWTGILAFGIALVVWLVAEIQLLQFSGSLVQGKSPSAPLAPGGGQIAEAPLRETVSPVEVVAFLAAQTRSLGVDWVSSTVTEPATTAGAAPGLEAWQASLNLGGTYPAVKRWMHEVTARYPNVVWTAARWTRPAGAAVPAAMPGAPGGDRLEVQLQMAWLRQAPRVAAPASAVAGFSGP